MQDARDKIRVLFLCTGNSCRSQMAEGWARSLLRETVEPSSAGIFAHYRRVRDEIRGFVMSLPDIIKKALG